MEFCVPTQDILNFNIIFQFEHQSNWKNEISILFTKCFKRHNNSTTKRFTWKRKKSNVKMFISEMSWDLSEQKE